MQVGPGRWLISLLEPSDSQIDGDCNLAAKGRQLKRAGRCSRCWRWVLKESSRALEPIFTKTVSHDCSCFVIRCTVRAGPFRPLVPSSYPNMNVTLLYLLGTWYCCTEPVLREYTNTSMCYQNNSSIDIPLLLCTANDTPPLTRGNYSLGLSRHASY